MIAFLVRTCASAFLGWLPAALMLLALALSGCGLKWSRPPVELYQGDPKAFEIPVTTIAVVPF